MHIFAGVGACLPKAGTPTPSPIVGLAPSAATIARQVAGRALRRREYFLDPKSKKFPPEYAHIIGVPFKLFKPGKTKYVEQVEPQEVRALPERNDFEITFPNLAGYRVVTLDAPIAADLDAVEPCDLDFTQTPPRAVLGNPVGPEKRVLSLHEALDLREQEVVFCIVQQPLPFRFRDEAGRPDIAQFAALRRIAADWLKGASWARPIRATATSCSTGRANGWRIARAPSAHTRRRRARHRHPVLNHYNPEGGALRFQTHGQARLSDEKAT